MIFNNGVPNAKPAKEKKTLPPQIVIVFTDDRREHLDFSSIKILENCLVVIDPVNEIPCEVHCYPLTSIRSFIFDYDTIKEGRTNLEDFYNGQ